MSTYTHAIRLQALLITFLLLSKTKLLGCLYEKYKYFLAPNSIRVLQNHWGPSQVLSYSWGSQNDSLSVSGLSDQLPLCLLENGSLSAWSDHTKSHCSWLSRFFCLGFCVFFPSRKPILCLFWTWLENIIPSPVSQDLPLIWDNLTSEVLTQLSIVMMPGLYSPELFLKLRLQCTPL